MAPESMEKQDRKRRRSECDPDTDEFRTDTFKTRPEAEARVLELREADAGVLETADILLHPTKKEASSRQDDSAALGDDELAQIVPSSGATEAVPHRADYISWDTYFMSLAYLSAMRSKDPSTQVGACIINTENKIVGIGYNGFPLGCADDQLPWARSAESELDTKYPYVCHAEMNAIMNKNGASLQGCRMYVALFPCNECAKLILQSGIREVIYGSDKYQHMNPFKASRRLFDLGGVNVRQFTPPCSKVTIDFGAMG